MAVTHFASLRSSSHHLQLTNMPPLLKPEELSAIQEIDLVTVAEAVHCDDGYDMPAGSTGTVVAIWQGGAGYEVEFAEPVGALATVMPHQILRHIPYARETEAEPVIYTSTTKGRGQSGP